MSRPHTAQAVAGASRIWPAKHTWQETLNAISEYTSDDTEGTKLRINQYTIKEEIGRGSYGAVHLATDQFGNEYVRGQSNAQEIHSCVY